MCPPAAPQRKQAGPTTAASRMSKLPLNANSPSTAKPRLAKPTSSWKGLSSQPMKLAANSSARVKALAAQSYTLETGQTRQSVTKAALAQLDAQRAQILNELSEWERKLCRSGVLRGVPGW